MTVFIPDSLVDESDVYPIPDNQEIFHNTDTKQSLIVEIVQHVEECDMHGKSPGEFYAMDLADMNDAALRLVVQPMNVGQDMLLLSARQEVNECIYCKGLLDEDRKVLHLLVIRIPSKGADVLISMQCPAVGGPAGGGGGEFPSEILKTFDILDFSLFEG